MEIVEDTETEPESVDTDPDERDSAQRRKAPSSEDIVSPTAKRELVSILKRGYSSETDQKDLSDLLDEALEHSPTTFLQKSKIPLVTSTPHVTKTRIDTQSVAEYLILDEADRPAPVSPKSYEIENGTGSGARKKVASNKEVSFAEAQDNEGKGSPVPRRMKLPSGEIREDCDSFYGSDKETDDALIFSDDTEIDVGSSSSEDGDANANGERKEDPLDKVEHSCKDVCIGRKLLNCSITRI